MTFKHPTIRKTIIITIALMVSAAVVAVPLRVVLNQTTAATIRTTLISKSLAVKSVVTNYPKGYAGTGWVRNLTGSGSTALNKANCQAATSTSAAAGWVWFADANGNGTTNDAEDGLCVATTTSSFGIAGGTASWNGAVNMVTSLASTTVTGTGSSNSLPTSGLTANALVNSVIVAAGPTGEGWGVVKANDATSVTVYGYWRAYNAYTATGYVPQNNDTFKIYDDYIYDNSWIGDYTCTGNFPNGQVVHNLYPPFPNTSGAGANATTSAIEIADCRDGKRDLLPNESDRAILSGTVTATTSLVIIDSSQNMATGTMMGEKLLITGGTGAGSYGLIEDNTGTTTTVGSWSGTAPDVGSTYSIIYIVPRGSYAATAVRFASNDDPLANKGPLTPEALDNWKGTRLPTFHDFFGYCGARSGDAYGSTGNSQYYNSGATAIPAIGKYGSNLARGKNSGNSNYLYLSNSGNYEWLSEQNNYSYARIAGGNACSGVSNTSVYTGYRFRAVFRP